MEVFLFRSKSESSVSGFTGDSSGDNLPAIYAPWYPMNDGRSMTLVAVNNCMADAIMRDGYFLLAGGRAAGPRSDDQGH
jgi:hypothetical protein